MRSYVTNWMKSRRTPTKLDRFIAKRKSGWPCDACVIHARFARDEIINLAARRSAPRFARNNILVPVFFFFSTGLLKHVSVSHRLVISCFFLLEKLNLSSKRNSGIHELPFDRNFCLRVNKTEALLISLENKAF